MGSPLLSEYQLGASTAPSAGLGTSGKKMSACLHVSEIVVETEATGRKANHCKVAAGREPQGGKPAVV